MGSHAAPLMLLLGGVMRGAKQSGRDGDVTTGAAAAAAAAAASLPLLSSVDEWRFAAPVQPHTLRLVHAPSRDQTAAAATAAAAAAAAAVPLSPNGGPASAAPAPPPFGTSAPRSMHLEVWALDSNSDEAQQLKQAEAAKAGTGTGTATATASPMSQRYPWSSSSAGPGSGWRLLLGPSHPVEFPPAADGADSDAADRNILLTLSVPPPAPRRDGGSGTPVTVPFSTQRVLVRGSYQHLSVMLYGSCSAAGANAASGAPLARNEARRMVDEMQRRRLRTLAASAAAVSSPSPHSDPAPRHAHACFRPLLALYQASTLRTLLFDPSQGGATAARLGSLLTSGRAVRTRADAAAHSLERLVRELRGLNLLPEAEKQREAHRAPWIDLAALERLGGLIVESLRLLDALDATACTSMLHGLRDDTSPTSHDMRQATRALSMLLACAAPDASMALPQCKEKNFTTMRRFVRTVSGAGTGAGAKAGASTAAGSAGCLRMPLSIARHIATLLARLLRADSMLVGAFVREGWLWLLGWMARPSAAQGSTSAPASASASVPVGYVGVDAAHRSLAMFVLNSLLVHPKALEALWKQDLLPDASSSSSSSDAFPALASLRSYGALALDCGAAATADGDLAVRGPARAAHRAVGDKLHLYGLFRAAHASFESARAVRNAPPPLNAEQIHATQRALLARLRPLLNFLVSVSAPTPAPAGEVEVEAPIVADAPAASLELSHAFLHHAAHFRLLPMLQHLLSSALGATQGGDAAAGTGAAATTAETVAAAAPLSPWELFQQLIRPLLMRSYFGPHASLQLVLSFFATQEEEAQEGKEAEAEAEAEALAAPRASLLASLRTLSTRLRPGAGATAGATHPQDGEALLPWQQVRQLIDWCESRAQALQLLLHAAPLDLPPPRPSSASVPAHSPRAREQSWNFLARFLQGHPFGTDAVAWVLGQAARFVASLPAPPPPSPAAAGASGSDLSSPVTPLVSLHQLFHSVFLERGPYAPLAQRHALACLNTLMSSSHAGPMFFCARGHLPLVSRAECDALVRSMGLGPAAGAAGGMPLASSSHRLASAATTWTGTTGLDERCVAQFLCSFGAVELVQKFGSGSGSGGAGWGTLLGIASVKLSRAARMSLGGQGASETVQLVRLLQCAHVLMRGDRAARYLVPELANHQLVVHAPNVPLFAGALTRRQARTVELANQQRVVEMLFKHKQAVATAGSGAGAGEDHSAAAAAAAAPSTVSPHVLRLLHLFCSAFSDEGGNGGGGGGGSSSSISSLSDGMSAGGVGAHAGALSPQGMSLMQQAAEGLDVLLALLRAALDFLCSAPASSHETAGGGSGGQGPDSDQHMEEGEVSPDSSSQPGSSPPVHPFSRMQLAPLHDALWKVHELLAGHDLFYHHFISARPDVTQCKQAQTEEASTECASVPPQSRSGSLGFFPRIRRNLHACLLHTLWHLLPPLHPAPAPSPFALAYPGEEGLPPLGVAPLRGAEKWWRECLFPVGRLSIWMASMHFLLDVMPQTGVRSGADAASRTEAVARLGARTAFEKAHLWAPLLTQLELGPPLPPGSPPLLQAPALLSSLLSDALLVSASLDLHSLLARLVGTVVESAPLEVGRAVLDRFVNQLGPRSKQTREAIEASMRDVRAATLAPPHPSNLLVSAAGLCADAQLVHMHFYRQMQLLHALLHYPRARWLLNDMEVLAWTKPLLQLAVPSGASMSDPVAAEYHPAVQEALAFQLIALECARLSLDSSPLAAVSAATELTTPERAHLLDGDVNWALVRPLWSDLVPLVLHSLPPLALAAGRVLIAAAQSGPGSRELLAWLSNPAHVRTLHERVWLRNKLSSPGPEAAVGGAGAGAGVGAGAGAGSGPPPKWIGNGSPLLLWLTARVDQWESSETNGGVSALELELWGQVATLLRCFITYGANHAQPPAQAGASLSPSSVPSHPPSHPPAPPPTDRWWAASVSSVFPGLRPLCQALGWPARRTPHAPSDTNMLHKAAAGSMPFLPIQPENPLARIATRLVAMGHAAADKEATGGAAASGSLSRSRSPSSLHLSSLVNAFHTLIYRCQLGGVLVLQEGKEAGAGSGAAAAASWPIHAKFAALARFQEQRPAATTEHTPAPSTPASEGSSCFDFLYPTSLTFAPAPLHFATTPPTPLPTSIATLSLRDNP